MTKRTLTVSEARKQLPRLIQEIMRGGGPFYFGPRGQAAAVLVSASQFDIRAAAGVVSEGLGAWQPLSLEILGDPDELQKDIREIRRQAVTSSVESWDRATTLVPRRQATTRKRKARP